MKRAFEDILVSWKNATGRKPLIVRGARQVGKTYTISRFGRDNFTGFVHVDFERNPRLASSFQDDLDPKKLLLRLEVAVGNKIVPGETLLFLDEIQACPRALKSLRYFFENLPSLHVVAAGSLMELVLEDVSFPVGSIDFAWMTPLTFKEFLVATGDDRAAEQLPGRQAREPLPPSIHQTLLDRLRLYFAVGGMPQAVAAYCRDRSLTDVNQVHESLMRSYLEDINKYRKRMEVDGVDRLLEAIPSGVGQPVKYERLEPDWRIEKTKRVLHLLERILLVTRVRACSAQGLPLGAGSSDKRFKYVFLDIGLMQHQCGLSANAILHQKDLLDVYRGALAEQFVGQELLARGGSELGKLYYWERAKPSSQAEVDYLLNRDGVIHPVEVKSGPSGKLRSLMVFRAEHKSSGDSLVLSTRNITMDKSNKIRYLPLYTLL